MDLTTVDAILDERKPKLNVPSFRFNSMLRLMRIRLLAPVLKHGDGHSPPCISYFYALGKLSTHKHGSDMKYAQNFARKLY